MRTPRYEGLIKRKFVSLLVLLLVPAMILSAVTVVHGSPELTDGEQISGSVTEQSKNWYLAEGATAGGMQTWILLYNPGEANASVTLSFHADGVVEGHVSTELEGAARVSINAGDFVNSYNLSTLVESNRPVVAESTIYDSERGSTHTSLGSAHTSTRWDFPEGAAVGSTYETWILLYNTGDKKTQARVSFHAHSGIVGPLSYELGARSRVSINMGDHVSGFNVGTVVESEIPIVAARTMYGEPIPEDPKARVVAIAHAQLGKPYRRGAAGPDAFDCSGLVQYCYLIGAGVGLPHNSNAQSNCGTQVPSEDLRPGDIVGFHGWGHVGIYIGDGQYIHAPQTGEVVRIAPLSAREDYCGAVRL